MNIAAVLVITIVLKERNLLAFAWQAISSETVVSYSLGNFDTQRSYH